MSNLYIGSDTTLRLNGLVNQSGTSDVYVTNATVTATLYEYTRMRHPSRAAAVTLSAGTKTGIPCEAHGFTSGQYVLIHGTLNYDGEYALDATTTADQLVIVASYVAETFTGKETIQRAVPSARALALTYIGSSNGNYKGTVPDTIDLIHNEQYHLVISVSDGTSTMVDRQLVRAQYHGE